MHYAFAHYALRQIAFARPIQVLGMLLDEMRNQFLEDVLTDLDERLKGGPPRDFTLADIEVVNFALEQRPCALLRMPPPANPTEVYFIALVSRFPYSDFVRLGRSGVVKGFLDYYTLERPVEISPERQSVFCGWTEDGAHQNYGEGPEPVQQKFIEFLMSHITKRENVRRPLDFLKLKPR